MSKHKSEHKSKHISEHISGHISTHMPGAYDLFCNGVCHVVAPRSWGSLVVPGTLLGGSLQVLWVHPMLIFPVGPRRNWVYTQVRACRILWLALRIGTYLSPNCWPELRCSPVLNIWPARLLKQPFVRIPHLPTSDWKLVGNEPHDCTSGGGVTWGRSRNPVDFETWH